MSQPNPKPSRDDLSVVLVTKTELVAVAEAFARSPLIRAMPTARPRAASQAANPQARPEDVLLVLGKNQDDGCEFYGAIIPAFVQCPSGPKKMGWMCMGYTNPEVRGVGFGHVLVQTAAACYGTVAATGANPLAERMYRKLGMQEMVTETFAHVPLTRLTPRTYLERCLRRLGITTWSQTSSVARSLKARAERGGSLVVRATPSPEAEAFRHTPKGPHFRRTAADARWTTENTWFPPGFVFTESERRYHFHVPEKEVTYACFEILDRRGRVRSGAVLAYVKDLSGTHVKLLDVFLKDEREKTDLLRAALAFALERGAKSLFLDRRYLSGASLLGRWCSLICRPMRQSYFVMTNDPEVKAAVGDLDVATTDCDLGFW